MSIAYVIHCDADRDTVEQKLLRPLPSNGFDRWVSSTFLSQNLKPEKAMEACDVIFAVVSRAAADSTNVTTEIEEGCTNLTPMIVVQVEDLTDENRSCFPEAVWQLPIIDLRKPEPEMRQVLAALLPAPEPGAGELADVAKQIEWNEEMLSEALARVLELRYYQQAETLIANLAQHIKDRPYPYPAKHAINDLKALRNQRQFKLMRQYGDAVISSGTQDEEVRRQYAQALIEQGVFDKALEVLNSIIADPKSRPREVEEAHGLIGRTYKQQYQDNPDAAGSHEFLRKAIAAYGFIYDNDPSKLWHGVNKASCIVRGYRDGVSGVELSEAKTIAENLLIELDRLGEAKTLWDYGTRVEALIILERYEEALAAVDVYIRHPEMRAFEPSSTYRQFDQLLQLGQEPRGKPILDRLFEAVQRYRGVDFPNQPPAPPAAPSFEAVSQEPVRRPLLIRVVDPEWQPVNVTDLVIEGRLGTIISGYGSDESVTELLNDITNVLAVNDSYPAGAHDCVKSVPFIRVADNYPGPGGGTFTEKGGKALVAIIDDGIDVLHHAFLDAPVQSGDPKQSRIVGIWDQTDTTGPPPAPFMYGTYHSDADIARYIQNNNTEKNLGRNKAGHGTHVASIAAGQKVGDFAGGVAPEARILVVIADGQSPIGYSKTHVDALVFIDKKASELKLPVVVNVSQGMNAGAHDGKSLLEEAFDRFTQDGKRPGRVVVKSAGNERHKNGHAKVTLLPGAVESVRWRRDPKALVAERLEVWWSSHDEFEFRLGSPAPREWTPWIGGLSNATQNGTCGGTPYSMEFTRYHVDNGHSQLRIKIGDILSSVASGSWELEIGSSGNNLKGGDIHAWIERGAGVPSSFETHMDEEITLSIPGTADSVISVGAIELMDQDRVRVGEFSSYGPTRDNREKPDIAAPGVGIQAARAGTSDGIVRMSGSSMAAPHVAGAVALLLSRRVGSNRPLLSASQITAVLQRKTRNYNGNWDRGQGYGVLDVGALLAAFATF